jgi:hypothetical protein
VRSLSVFTPIHCPRLKDFADMTQPQKTLEELRQLVVADNYHYSSHAEDKIAECNVTDREVREVVLSGEVLETYTEDARGWSYLLLGFPKARTLHVQIGFNRWRQLAIIITVYEPSPPKWITPRQRGEGHE